MRSVRILVAILLAVLLLAATPVRGTARHAASIAGRWHGVAIIACLRNAHNAKVCDTLLGGPFSTLSYWFDLTSDAAGNFRFKAGNIYAEKAAGAPPRCGPAIFTKPFNGSCFYTDYGRGFVKQGMTHGLEVWIAAETATFHNQLPVAAVHDPLGAKNYPIDTGVRLRVASYNTGQYLAMVGLLTRGTSLPTGVFVRIDVTRD